MPLNERCGSQESAPEKARFVKSINFAHSGRLSGSSWNARNINEECVREAVSAAGLSPWPDLMSHSMRVLRPKDYGRSLPRKVLNKPEDTLYTGSKQQEEMVMQENGADYDEYNTKEVLEEALHHNVPDAVSRLSQERHGREVCIVRLQAIEKELEQFSEEFGSELHNLRKSMNDLMYSMPNSRAVKDEHWPENGIPKDGDLRIA